MFDLWDHQAAQDIFCRKALLKHNKRRCKKHYLTWEHHGQLVLKQPEPQKDTYVPEDSKTTADQSDQSDTSTSNKQEKHIK